jgi:hypothetical protein
MQGVFRDIEQAGLTGSVMKSVETTRVYFGSDTRDEGTGTRKPSPCAEYRHDDRILQPIVSRLMGTADRTIMS